MAEENQQQVATKELQQVTTKNPKKVEAGKRLAAHNHRKREEKKMKNEATSGVNQYYGIGAVLAVGVIGGLGYYIYRTKKGGPKSLGPQYSEGPASRDGSVPVSQQSCPKTNKFEMD